MLKKSEWENKLDTFLYATYPSETPAYLAIMRDRIWDLCSRGISEDSAVAYLRSGGWSTSFAEVYSKFLSYCNSAKKENTQMADTEPKLFTKSQTQKLLQELVLEFADCVGYPHPEVDDDFKEYRASFMKHLKDTYGSTSPMSDVGKAQMVDYLGQIKEMSSALLSYVESLS